MDYTKESSFYRDGGKVTDEDFSTERNTISVKGIEWEIFKVNTEKELSNKEQQLMYLLPSLFCLFLSIPGFLFG